MRVLVTGGAGFIARTIVDALVDPPGRRHVLDDLDTVCGKTSTRAASSSWFGRRPRSGGDTIAGCDLVFHQAAHKAVLRSSRLVVGAGAPPYTLLEDACTTRLTPASERGLETCSGVVDLSGFKDARPTAAPLCGRPGGTPDRTPASCRAPDRVGEPNHDETRARVDVFPHTGIEVRRAR